MSDPLSDEELEVAPYAADSVESDDSADEVADVDADSQGEAETDSQGEADVDADVDAEADVSMDGMEDDNDNDNDDENNNEEDDENDNANETEIASEDKAQTVAEVEVEAKAEVEAVVEDVRPKRKRPGRKKGSKNAAQVPRAQKRKDFIPSVKDLGIPFRAIKRIMKIDKDIGTVQNEAAIVATYAVELFVEKMVKCSHDNAQKRGRNTVKYEDLAEVRVTYNNLNFLNTLIP
mmetsp:Transcript_15458/g.23158  ORF Transcript_15458/g.23158 Transcript_15458/m.23158 type:complete len:234 (+) Transcript_15458:134-835(+)